MKFVSQSASDSDLSDWSDDDKQEAIISNIPIADRPDVESDGKITYDEEYGKESNLDLQENDDSDNEISDWNVEKSNGETSENYVPR